MKGSQVALLAVGGLAAYSLLSGKRQTPATADAGAGGGISLGGISLGGGDTGLIEILSGMMVMFERTTGAIINRDSFDGGILDLVPDSGIPFIDEALDALNKAREAYDSAKEAKEGAADIYNTAKEEVNKWVTEAAKGLTDFAANNGEVPTPKGTPGGDSEAATSVKPGVKTFEPRGAVGQIQGSLAALIGGGIETAIINPLNDIARAINPTIPPTSDAEYSMRATDQMVERGVTHGLIPDPSIPVDQGGAAPKGSEYIEVAPGNFFFHIPGF